MAEIWLDAPKKAYGKIFYPLKEANGIKFVVGKSNLRIMHKKVHFEIAA